jgi:ADP-ribose pyrophosphatase
MTDRPLPPNARLVPQQASRVFKGEIFDVYQWQQEMFDGSFETFEMIKRPDTVKIIAIDDGKIIALDEEQPEDDVRTHTLPGGRVDPTDTSVLEAAKRELLEETGLEFKDWYLLQITQRIPKIEWFWYTFVAQNKVAEHPTKLDAGERIAVKHVSYEELKSDYGEALGLVEAFNNCDTLEEFLSGIRV